MILAIDTSTSWISLAVTDETSILAEHTWRISDNHTSELAPGIEMTLREAGISAAELRAVAVALGPGSFTRLRIGLGFAKGLAIAHTLDIIGVPTHDIIALPQPGFAGTLMAVLQMGRGRIAAAIYHRRDTTWVASTMAVITTWDDLLSLTESDTVYVCGELDDDGRSILGDRVHLGSASLNVRRAACLAEIAHDRLVSGQADELSALVPIYLQQPPTTSGSTEADKE